MITSIVIYSIKEVNIMNSLEIARDLTVAALANCDNITTCKESGEDVVELFTAIYKSVDIIIADLKPTEVQLNPDNVM